MTTQPQARLLTAEAFTQLPEDGRRHEPVNGVLKEVSRSEPIHGLVGALLAAHLVRHAVPRRLGKVFSDVGFVLRRKPDTLQAPDVAFVAAARLADHDLNENFVGAPDLAIEIAFADKVTNKALSKIEEYFEAGARAVWIVYPERRKVYAYSDPNRVQIVLADGMLTGSDNLARSQLGSSRTFQRSGRLT
ncbi:MAG: Uma2 family endonuclease [Anaerolineae bacterium]|nr:Uma2 family endonuclease [Anaerolineae bacterium]